MSEFLFVYGSLARNAEHEMHQHLVRNADYVGEGYFNGQLYLAGPYPGAVPSSHPDDKVFGELYRLRNPQDVFAHLDEYEGCGPNDPPPTEFVRRIESIFRDNGTRSEAWIYFFNREVADLPRIASGRFTAR